MIGMVVVHLYDARKCDIYLPAIKPKAEHLALSERTKQARAIKQKKVLIHLNVPMGKKKKAQEEILAAMETIGNLPMFVQITDERIGRLHGFDKKSFARLAKESKLTSDPKEHQDSEIPPPSQRPSQVSNNDVHENDELKNQSANEGPASPSTTGQEEFESGRRESGVTIGVGVGGEGVSVEGSIN